METRTPEKRLKDEQWERVKVGVAHFLGRATAFSCIVLFFVCAVLRVSGVIEMSWLVITAFIWVPLLLFFSAIFTWTFLNWPMVKEKAMRTKKCRLRMAQIEIELERNISSSEKLKLLEEMGKLVNEMK